MGKLTRLFRWVLKSREPFPAVVRNKREMLLALKTEERDHEPRNVGNL